MKVVHEHDPGIGRHAVALGEADNVARRDFLGINLPFLAVSYDSGSLFEICLKLGKGAFRLVFLPKAEEGIHGNSDENKDGIAVMRNGESDRSGRDKDENERTFKLA